MTTRRSFETDLVDAAHARIKPLHDAIVASVPLLADAYLAEVGKLFRTSDQRPTNDRLQGGCQESRVSTVMSDAEPVSDFKVSIQPHTPRVRHI